MSKKLYPEEDIRNIANAIREKSGTQDSYYISGMSNAILNIPSGGGEDHNTLKSLIEGTLTDITSDAEVIANNLFKGHTSLNSAYFPKATDIGEHAFYGCQNLRYYDFSNVINIGSSAFYYCKGINNFDTFCNAVKLGDLCFNNCTAFPNNNAFFPNVKHIGINTFYNCALKTAYFPNAEYVGNNCFGGYSRPLETAYFPNLKIIGNNAFNSCYYLNNYNFANVTDIHNYAFYFASNLAVDMNADCFPNVINIGSSAFMSIVSLKSINFPKAANIGPFAFYNCRNLITADFSNAIYMNNKVFGGCYNLNTMILRSNNICNIFDINVFNNTAFTNNLKGGNLYVPQALLEDYKVANQWNLLYAMENVNFLPIEGSPYEIV